MKSYIYRIHNLSNGKSYIGLTTKTINKRWKSHLAKSKYLNLPLYRSIRKNGLENFAIELIEECSNISFEELCKKECDYIAIYNSFYPNGYNMTLGGEGTVGVKLSEETRKKMSEIRCGKKHPPRSAESKEKIRKARVGSKSSQVTKDKLSRLNSGKGNPRFGVKLSVEQKQKAVESRFANVPSFFLLSPTGEIFAVKNCTQFAKLHGLTPTHVIRLKNQQTKSHKGWTLINPDV